MVKFLRSSKGSLSLSINAVVILVLAITMLGLGLGFTKGMFGKFQEKLTVPEPPSPATASEQIVLPTGDAVEIRVGRDAELSVNFYNDYITQSWEPTILCYSAYAKSAEDADGEPNFGVSAVKQIVESGTQRGFKLLLSTSTLTSGKDVCKVRFTGTQLNAQGEEISSGTKTTVEKQIIISMV